MEDDEEQRPDSLLPYEKWIESALRHVVAQAIEYVATEGLPGGHHFYLTFRTDHPDVNIPQRLRTQYPREMTIVLQHQFWDLKFDHDAEQISVGLSFGGVPSMLVIPLDAMIGFADPHIRYGLRFQPVMPDTPAESDAPADPPAPAAQDGQAPSEEQPTEQPQVVSLDAFRRRTPPKT
ncbi:MAG TPA: ClpXP protease specificity-enhancing factor SspB [Acetobacteraceae bacterium]|jgi:hypothetical protein